MATIYTMHYELRPLPSKLDREILFGSFRVFPVPFVDPNKAGDKILSIF